MFFLTKNGLIYAAHVEFNAYHPVHEEDGSVLPMWRLSSTIGQEYMIEGAVASEKVQKWILDSSGNDNVDFSDKHRPAS